MTLSSGVHKTVAEAEDAVTEELGGRWDCWAVMTHDRRMLWSARPAGALAAVITGCTDTADLAKTVLKYEADVTSHLNDAKSKLADCPVTGAGQDRARVLTQLIAALENLAGSTGG